MNNLIPDKQYAVQLTGPDELQLNKAKDVFKPGPHQVLGRIEAVGLCFSDLKLLKQFSAHARKSRVLSGIEPAVLEEIPSYVPEEQATVPGHETVVRICAVGDKVRQAELGKRYLVQTDYRHMPTANSSSSFGYNFEGGLQEYVLMDERVIIPPEGESFLLPASEDISASAIGLVEPWACVEQAYAVKERQTIKAGGQMLVVADVTVDEQVFGRFLERFGRSDNISWVSTLPAPKFEETALDVKGGLGELAEDAVFDDVLYFGSNAETAAKLMPRIAMKGLMNIILGGKRFSSDVVTQVGRTHYGGIRIVGTAGSDPAESMEYIPASGEIRTGDKVNVIGAGGPMGVMHVIRNICQGVEKVSIYAGEISSERIAELNRIAKPLAQQNRIEYHPYNPQTDKLKVGFDYVALMAPIPQLVTSSVQTAAQGGIINIFAGIPASVSAQIDMNRYIEKQLYFIGTSGSVLEDMKVVLNKVESGRLDTNLSVGAVCGLDGAVAGIRAVENHEISGKIIVYPACKGLDLTRLEELAEVMPAVAAHLNNGLWNQKAEAALIAEFQGSK
ncbi:MAG: alcohol dehydrogenase catalytic domain-containing protein [Sedimentisphaerales bacterium]|nr:alcohol dehydrogenase catalytic domain-containing protein [Sedimentisphaerales bacterium]